MSVQAKGEQAAGAPAGANLMDPAVQQCPYHAYRWMRENAPVYHDAGTRMYFVTTYDLLRQVMRDPVTFSSALDWNSLRPGGSVKKSSEFYKEKGFPRIPSLSQTDDPLHADKRALVEAAFTAGRIKKMTPYVDQVTNELIDNFIDRGECEFVADFAVPLPCIIIADQIGVPRSDIHLFKYWSDASMKLISNMASDEEELACTAIVVEGQHYLKSIIDERRKHPKDDMITTIIEGRIDGGRRLTDAEIIAILNELLVGGNETTTSSLSSGMKLLLDNPRALAALKADPSLLKTFVEEAIRLETPIQGLYRVTTREVELGGVVLPKGAVINMRYSAANRDDGIFENADALDITRANAGAHFAFGSGIHFCLGAPLARREMLSAFSALLARLDGFAYKKGHENPRYLPSLLQRSLEDLWITFSKRAA